MRIFTTLISQSINQLFQEWLFLFDFRTFLKRFGYLKKYVWLTAIYNYFKQREVRWLAPIPGLFQKPGRPNLPWPTFYLQLSCIIDQMGQNGWRVPNNTSGIISFGDLEFFSSLICNWLSLISKRILHEFKTNIFYFHRNNNGKRSLTLKWETK